jgi:uncharacterized membrane protein YagU involved in acid resistance
MNTSTRFAQPAVPRAFPVIVWGGLLAGTLDATDGVVAYGFQGLNPIQVLQYIASGAFGAASFHGGLLTAGAGVIFHFFIAFAVATTFYLACRLVPQLARHYISSGLAYGAGVFFFMNYIVLPHTAVAPSPFSLPMFLNGVIGHAVFVGLTLAWFAHRSVKNQTK